MALTRLQWFRRVILATAMLVVVGGVAGEGGAVRGGESREPFLRPPEATRVAVSDRDHVAPDRLHVIEELGARGGDDLPQDTLDVLDEGAKLRSEGGRGLARHDELLVRARVRNAGTLPEIRTAVKHRAA